MMKELVETSSLAAEAYGIVRQRILSGELALGQVISRRKLAAELGMSFLPVSEALLRLEFEGLLESRPRAGTRVRIPSPEDVKGHFVVREALEVQAAVLFTRQATAAERADLRKMAARVDALRLQPDRLLYIGVHMKLHRRISECARCPAHALNTIWFGAIRQPSPGDVPHRHADLLEAVSSGDPLRAADATREHLAVGMQRTLDVLEPYFRLRKANGRTFFRSDRQLRRTTLGLGSNTIN
jgi:DNA-binding GntR family transcriptional regulator